MSPDGTVTVEHSSGRRVEVFYTPTSRVTHNDDSFAQQVGIAVTELISGYRRGRGDRGESGGRISERRRAVKAELAAVAVRQTSPTGYVTIGLSAADSVEVHIQHRALVNRGPSVIVHEINTALNKALYEYRQRGLAIRRRYYGEIPDFAGAAD